MNYTGSKVKLSRRLGIPLTPKAQRYMKRKPYPPGQLGGRRSRFSSKFSDYKRQLIEKQRLKAQYNILEKQLRHYFKNASKRTGNTPDSLIQILESRLDAFVFRSGFAPTIYAARQYVSHGHFLVNGKRVNIPSYHLKEKDREDVPVTYELPLVIQFYSR